MGQGTSTPAQLQNLYHTFQQRALERTADLLGGNHDPAFQLLGRGGDDIARGLAALEPRAKTSMCNIQPTYPFFVDDTAPALNARSAARGVEMPFIVAASAISMNALLTSVAPDVRVAPVFGPLMLIDRSLTVVAGSRTDRGYVTAWTTDDATLVGLANDLWDRTYAVSVPALPDGRPPLTARQVEAARMVARGATDERIAHELHVSTRTVTADIRAVCALVGAGSRAEMVAKLLRPSI